MNVALLFGALVAAHALCDYPLQGDFLARAKNRAAPIAGVPWYQDCQARAESIARNHRPPRGSLMDRQSQSVEEL
jgi:hypothetical protein